ncbi:Maf family protein [Butyrivibrio sp. TB]|jgi:septum formation protein|uniref:Maf family protein n=1 Tax=Butyrivibrio sp. TB TaxID=1520809 RepID=UPI000B87AE74|nr:Maf family protein [Butyrivibrio sp. TB]
MATKIVLASGSPRRRELMQQAGLSFEVKPATGEEIITSNIPQEVVKELSFQKAAEIFAQETGSKVKRDEIIFLSDKILQELSVNGNFDKKSSDKFGNFSEGDIQSPVVIGADTVVSYKQKILGKPKDKDDARNMISGIQGDKHEVYTGVTVLWKQDDKVHSLVFAEETLVFVYPMTDEQIEGYISTDEPYDKAGAYGIQGMFGVYVKGIHGDYNNVVGLPIARLYQALMNYNLV